MLGFSQEKLGEAVGLTSQQVQKYERGVNRVGASRLLEIAQVLDVPVSFFYDDVDRVQAPPVENTRPEFDVFQQPEAAQLVAAYHLIADPVVRQRLIDLSIALSTAAAKGQRTKKTGRAADPRAALRALLAVVDLADRDSGIDNSLYEAARCDARMVLAAYKSGQS
jgi:transcriptional regulator with XRE-family HTH domain